MKILSWMNPWRTIDMVLETGYDPGVSRQLLINRLVNLKIYSGKTTLTLLGSGVKVSVIFEQVGPGSRVHLRSALAGALFTTVWGCVAILLPVYMLLKVSGVIPSPHSLTWEQGLFVSVGNILLFLVVNGSGPFKLERTAKLLENQVRTILGAI